MTERKVWYLAHPLKPDELYSVQQNLDHVVHLTRHFFESDVYVCTPYHTTMLALDDDNLDHRNAGIEMDIAVLMRLNKIICVGHKLSYGMSKELELVEKQNGEIHNLVGLGSKQIRAYLNQYYADFK